MCVCFTGDHAWRWSHYQILCQGDSHNNHYLITTCLLAVRRVSSTDITSLVDDIGRLIGLSTGMASFLASMYWLAHIYYQRYQYVLGNGLNKNQLYASNLPASCTRKSWIYSSCKHEGFLIAIERETFFRIISLNHETSTKFLVCMVQAELVITIET